MTTRSKRRRPRRPAGRWLGEELGRLQRLGLGASLRRVLWVPAGRADVDAEVKGDEVCIYAAQRDAAVRALRHEVLHYEIARCSVPYVRLINRLLADVNDESYRRSERLAETLEELLGP